MATKKDRQKRKQLMRSLSHAARTGQVPIKDKRTGQVEMADIETLKTFRTPFDLSADECREVAVERVTLNLRETKHPFHHKTADGTIVTPDPTLEYYISRFSEEQRKQFREIYAPTPEQEAQAPKAVPVDRKYYGDDMYEGKYPYA